MIAYRLLEMEFSDNDSLIRSAYLKKIKQFPPERFPEEYKVIRKAYELVETNQKRIEYFLYGNDMEFDYEDYRKLLLRIDKTITKIKWDTVCKMYQENK
ncbi:hypothetical protein KKA14_15835 [bacterium]|nr:hypothetical protein [bacterium]